MDRMRPCLGISVTSDAVRAVLLHDGRIRWAGEAAWAEGAPVADPLSAVLARMPRKRRRFWLACAAIGPAHSQLKQLVGFPATVNSATSRRLLAANQVSFFAADPERWITGGILRRSSAVWAAAVRSDVTGGIVDALAAARIPVRAVVPAAAVLPAASALEMFSWSDGDVRIDIRRAGAELAEVRRVVATAPAALPELAPSPLLSNLGDRAVPYAAAFGAAASCRSDWLAVCVRPERQISIDLLRGSMKGPAIVALLAVVVTALAPLRYRHAADRHEAELQHIRSTEIWRVADSAAHQLRQLSRLTQEARVFASQGRPIAATLSQLAQALPPSMVVLDMALNDSAGALTVRGGSAAELSGILDTVPVIAIREVVGGRAAEGRNASGTVQTATARFTVRAVPQSSSSTQPVR
jgi:hypothetical protein